LLKTLADQAGIAANNVRLRKLVQSLAVREEHSGLLKRSSYFDALMFEVTRSLQQRTPLTLALMRFGPDSLVRGMGEKQADAALVSARAEGADATQSIKPPMEPAPEQAQATWL